MKHIQIYEVFELNVRHYWQIYVKDDEGFIFEIALWKLAKKYPNGEYFLLSKTAHEEIKKYYYKGKKDYFYVSVFNDNWMCGWTKPKETSFWAVKFEGNIEVTLEDKEQYYLEQTANQYNL